MNIKAYYKLLKPGVLYGNAFTAAAGFLFASHGNVHWVTFVHVLIGSSLIIGSACVINNYFDQDIDAVMTRTKTRPLITGEVSGRGAVIFGTFLGLLGLTELIMFSNHLVVIAGIIGFITYVFLYGMWSKRRNLHGTAVGSVSGAIPILAGYLGASGAVDAGAILVFAILFFWQFPEFYSIAIYRRKEYKAAGVPVITVVKSIKLTKQQIFGYTLCFVASTMLLAVYETTSFTYLLIMAMLGIYWIWLGYQGLRTSKNDDWAHKMFHTSLIMLMAFSILLCVNAWLP